MKLKQIYQIVLIIGVAIAILGCSTRPTQDTLEGVWEKNGYGTLLEITENEINFYDVTKMSCILNTSLERSEIKRLGKLNLLANDTFTQTLGITEYTFNRINTLPKVEVDTSSNLKKQLFNFDVFWHTLNENYAFFTERNVDWNAVYKVNRPKITESTTDEELYTILMNTTDGLQDEHTFIRASDDSMEKYENNSADTLVATGGKPSIEMKDAAMGILNTYVEDPKLFGKDLKGKGLFNWGSINENVGYLQINNMIFFADYVVPDSLSGYDYLFAYLDKSNDNSLYQEHEVEGVAKLMDSVIREFQDKEAVLLDLRFNLGGYDAVSLEILSRFIKERTFLFSKKARVEDGFTIPQRISLAPSRVSFEKPVYVLTSHQTSSAPESLVMGSLAVPSITSIGSNTMGILSDVLEKKLPNGWDLYLSNEVFQNYKGDVPENIGIPADIVIEYPEDEEAFSSELYQGLENGDEAIEFALNHLLQNTSKTN